MSICDSFKYQSRLHGIFSKIFRAPAVLAKAIPDDQVRSLACQMTLGVLSNRSCNAASPSSIVRRMRRSVSAMMSAIEEAGRDGSMIGQHAGHSSALEGEQLFHQQCIAVTCTNRLRCFDHRVLA